MTIPILQYEDLQYLQCYYTEKVSLARIEKLEILRSHLMNEIGFQLIETGCNWFQNRFI